MYIKRLIYSTIYKSRAIQKAGLKYKIRSFKHKLSIMWTEHQSKPFCSNTSRQKPKQPSRDGKTAGNHGRILKAFQSLASIPSQVARGTPALHFCKTPRIFLIYFSLLKLARAGFCYLKTRNLTPNTSITCALPLLPGLHPRTSLPKTFTPFITPISFLTPLSNHQCTDLA